MSLPAVRALIAPVLLMALLAGAPSRAAALSPAPLDSPTQLKNLIEQIVAAGAAGNTAREAQLIGALALPGFDAWFKKVFGAENGAKLSAEYAGLAPQLVPQLKELFATARSRGPVKVTAFRLSGPDDRNATGLQKSALEAMKQPVALYTVELGGISVWSFAYAGGFRLVGKLRALR